MVELSDIRDAETLASALWQAEAEKHALAEALDADTFSDIAFAIAFAEADGLKRAAIAANDEVTRLRERRATQQRMAEMDRR
jgi:hypothetical protein